MIEKDKNVKIKNVKIKFQKFLLMRGPHFIVVNVKKFKNCWIIF